MYYPGSWTWEENQGWRTLVLKCNKNNYDWLTGKRVFASIPVLYWMHAELWVNRWDTKFSGIGGKLRTQCHQIFMLIHICTCFSLRFALTWCVFILHFKTRVRHPRWQTRTQSGCSCTIAQHPIIISRPECLWLCVCALCTYATVTATATNDWYICSKV